jgi:hypothetical protein
MVWYPRICAEANYWESYHINFEIRISYTVFIIEDFVVNAREIRLYLKICSLKDLDVYMSSEQILADVDSLPFILKLLIVYHVWC